MASTHKPGIFAIRLHPVPEGVDQQVFTRRYCEFAAGALSVPSVAANVDKVTVLSQTSKLEAYMAGFGLSSEHKYLCGIAEAENAEKLREIFADSQLAELYASAGEFGIQSPTATARIFSADPVYYIDSRVECNTILGEGAGTYIVGIYSAPSGMSAEEFRNKVDAVWVSKWGIIPARRLRCF
ncbi:hypothetical protein MKEN_00970800 [Mycena kentingensis (nom. inval.)]|nr:hypothetical protein MKEN_00970800 [Mycena kentingensis (nom. inval.)]